MFTRKERAIPFGHWWNWMLWSQSYSTHNKMCLARKNGNSTSIAEGDLLVNVPIENVRYDPRRRLYWARCTFKKKLLFFHIPAIFVWEIDEG